MSKKSELERIKPINVALIFIAVASVLSLRMETAKVSYEISRTFDRLKSDEAQTRLLGARYEHEVGSERMVSEAEGMVALSAPKAHQVVMIDKTGLAITR